MAFYKKFQSKLNDLWYPRAITTGIPITTDRIADKALFAVYRYPGRYVCCA